jgi:energy-coupling factor transport system permease protein
MNSASTENKGNKNLIHLVQNYSVFEFVFICVLATSIGVAYWGWTFVYEITKPFLKLIGLNYLSSGFWLFIGVFIPAIVRRPFAAIAASMIAAGVEGFMTHWGLMALVWGLAQGLGAEVVFLFFGYRRWDFKVLLLAAFFSASASYALDYFYYGYEHLIIQLKLTQYISFVLSAFIFAAYLSFVLIRRLNKLNLLSRFLIAQS